MRFLVPVALIGWIPLVISLFTFLPPRRAVVTAFLVAWLFLPMAGYEFSGIPEYTKMSATCFGVLMGAAIFDLDRLMKFRFSWVDLPMAIFCICPFFSSVTNGLGWYDGLSATNNEIVRWGMPYYIGRVYFQTLDDVRELAVGLVIGGLIYIPLCWLEIRFSPQLHRWVYGYHQHSFAQTKRLGGFRPMVFMQHGLMLSMWMTLTGLVSVWLWKSKTWRESWGMPAALLSLALVFTAVWTRSSFAIVLLLLGLGAMFSVLVLRTRLGVVALLLIPPAFITLRTTQIVDGYGMVETVNEWFGEDRAASLLVRVENDNALSQRALEQPLFGWGGWGRARIHNEEGQDVTITDSLWIIIFGNRGLVGLLSLVAAMLLPMALVMRDYKVEMWAHPRVAPVFALSLVLVLYMIDGLMNAMLNPIYVVAAGAVSSAHLWAVAQKRMIAEAQRVPTRRVAPQGPAPVAIRPM